MAAVTQHVLVLGILAVRVASAEQCDCEALRLEIARLRAEVASLRGSSAAVASPARHLEEATSCPDWVTLRSDSEVSNFASSWVCQTQTLFITGGVTSLTVLANPFFQPSFGQQITTLKVSQTVALESLEGLERLTGVEYLTIEQNSGLTSLWGLRNVQTVASLIVKDNAMLTTFGLESLTSVSSMIIHGNPNLPSLLGAWSLEFANRVTVTANARLHELMGFEHIQSLDVLEVHDVPSLSSLSSFQGLQIITYKFEIVNTGLTSLAGLENLTSVDTELRIEGNTQLSSLAGLGSLESVTLDLRIQGNPSLTDLSGLRSLRSAGAVWICDNDGLWKLSGLDSFVRIIDTLTIERNRGLESISSLQGVQTVGGLITVGGNTNLGSLAGLGQLTSVRALHSSGNGLKSLGLNGLASVELELKIESEKWLFTLDGLEDLTHVGALHLTDLNIGLLTPLKHLAYAWGGLLVTNCVQLSSLKGLALSRASQLSVTRWDLGRASSRDPIRMTALGGPFLAGAAIDRIQMDEDLWPKCITPQEHSAFVSVVVSMEDSIIPPASWQRWYDNGCSWVDREGPEGSIFACSKGQPCALSGFNKSRLTSRIDAGGLNSVFVSNLSEGCGICSEFHQQRNRTVSLGGIVDFDYVLADEGAGYRSICWCDFLEQVDTALVGPLADLVLRGPRPGGEAVVCRRGHKCTFKVDGVALEPTDSMVLMSSCEEGDPSRGTAASRIAENEYHIDDVVTWYEKDPTRYEVCWKAPCSSTACPPPQDRYFLAGTLELFGVYPRNYDPVMGQHFTVPNIGFGVSDGDRMRIRKTCGKANEDGLDNALEAHSSAMLFDFGALAKDRVRAGELNLCWCQAYDGSECTAEGDFMAVSGIVTILCPAEEEPTSTGECRQCPAGKQRTTPGLAPCSLDNQSVALLAALFLSVGACCAVLVQIPARRLSVVDVSLEDRRTLVTMFWSHRLSHFGRSSLPVTLQDTGHPGLGVPFRARVQDALRLELLAQDGSPISESRLDTSKGTLTVVFPHDYYHQGRPLPTVLGLLLLLGTTAALSILIQSSEVGEIAFAGGVVAALLSTAASAAFRWWPWATPLDQRLLEFKKEKLPKLERSLKLRPKGPERAVSVGQLHELLDFFRDFIRDRTAYFLDSNVLQPLTKGERLSFAELAGAGQVEWFVSHFWGTAFQHFCTALKKHAEAVCGERPWTELRYWVCFCSNNQHYIEEELGLSWKESSFYIALKSGLCQGTCMVLDDKALPLTRIWCIFELLQTCMLEKSEANFQGLLLCTSTGVLNTGNGSVDVAMALARKVAEMDLETARASSPKDELMIRDLVVKEMGSFSVLNAFTRGEVRKMLVRAKENSGQQFDNVVALLADDMAPDVENV